MFDNIENTDLLKDQNSEYPQFEMGGSIYSQPVPEAAMYNEPAPVAEDDQIPVFKEDGEFNEMPTLVSAEPEADRPMDLEELPAYDQSDSTFEEVKPVEVPAEQTVYEPIAASVEEPTLKAAVEPMVETPVVEETTAYEPAVNESLYSALEPEEEEVVEPTPVEEEPMVVEEEPVVEEAEDKEIGEVTPVEETAETTPTFVTPEASYQELEGPADEFGADLMKKYELLEEKIAANKELIGQYNELAARVGTLRDQIDQNDKDINSGLGNAL